MPFVSFDSLPSTARLWAFAAPRTLTSIETESLAEEVRTFLGGWAAHGDALTAGLTIVENRFLLVGVDQASTAPSGCSIDAMVRFLKDYSDRHDIDLVDAPSCCRRTTSGIVCESRESFASLVVSGAISDDTTVFDLTAASVGDVREGRFERPFAGSWYEKAFAPVTG